MTGVTDEGNTSGICINDAGADGKYADFIFLGDGNKENPGVDIDLKKFYRQILKVKVHGYVIMQRIRLLLQIKRAGRLRVL